jgi:tetratricopeptide (TPR) repeat protein
MNRSQFALLFSTILILTGLEDNFAEDILYSPKRPSEAATKLNKDGVLALKRIDPSPRDGYPREFGSADWQSVFNKFEAALKIDPGYTSARRNLSIAHSNFALYLDSHHKRAEAIDQLHQALFADPNNGVASDNLSGIIEHTGKNPHSFEDRLTMGDKANACGDFVGAIIEYKAALKIKDNRSLHKKIADAYMALSRANENAAK